MKRGWISQAWNFCSALIGREKRGSRSGHGNVEQIYSKRAEAYTPEKQKKLETLCERLFSQKELITAGKLQFLGLGKIKKRLGKTWAGLQPIVYSAVESAIAKYMMPTDIFIRYKDDTYVIIFANASPEEAQIKATLIAEEIRRQLFESGEGELRNLQIEESVAIVSTEKLKSAGGFDKAMDAVVNDIEKKKPEDTKKDRKPVEITPSIEVDPYETRPQQETVKIETNPYGLNFTYMPLWDVKRNLLTTYLCLAHKGLSKGDPLDDHEMIFESIPPSEKTAIDLCVLQAVAAELSIMAKEGRKLFIACPVHYETLYRGENYAPYVLECQKIPPEQKRYLIFLLLDLPPRFHHLNIHKFTVPLRNHCAAIYAQVPLDTPVDFALIRECHFEAVGVRLKKVKSGEKAILALLDKFARKSKNALISKIFALDVGSLSITTSAVCADYDLLGGPAIHTCVEEPDNIYRYKHENLFTDLLKKQIAS